MLKRRLEIKARGCCRHVFLVQVTVQLRYRLQYSSDMADRETSKQNDAVFDDTVFNDTKLMRNKHRRETKKS